MPVNATELLEEILRGRLLGPVIKVYEGLLGPWFWAVFVGFTLVLTAVKSKGNPAAILVVCAVWLFALGGLLPYAVHKMLYAVMVGCVAVILYRAFRPGG